MSKNAFCLLVLFIAGFAFGGAGALFYGGCDFLPVQRGFGRPSVRQSAVFPVTGLQVRPVGIEAVHSHILEQLGDFAGAGIASHAVRVNRGNEVGATFWRSRIVSGPEISAGLLNDLSNAVCRVEPVGNRFLELLERDAFQQFAFQVIGFCVSHGSNSTALPQTGNLSGLVNRGFPLIPFQGAT